MVSAWSVMNTLRGCTSQLPPQNGTTRYDEAYVNDETLGIESWIADAPGSQHDMKGNLLLRLPQVVLHRSVCTYQRWSEFALAGSK